MIKKYMKNYLPNLKIMLQCGILVILALLLFFNILLFNLPFNEQEARLYAANTVPINLIVKNKKTTPPETVRGIYLTAYSASRDEWRHNLIEKMKKGRINTVVIDIKDYTGYILYKSEIPVIKEFDLTNPLVKDLKSVVEEFKESGIYTIARQTLFQDPALARAKPEWAIKTKAGGTWYNYNGLSWTDPGNKEVWDYNIDIALEANRLGFDEINFDYMRYPSDGNLKTIDFNIPEGKAKADMLGEFFSYLSDKLSPKVNISVDLFGMVMDNVNTEYDLGIGQRLDKALDSFDYICPMMYPSHYYSGYMGFANPAAHPGAVIEHGINLTKQVFTGSRASLRPWLQAFNMGAVYDKPLIDAQTEATEAATTTSGWLLWNARNYYPDYIFQP